MSSPARMRWTNGPHIVAPHVQPQRLKQKGLSDMEAETVVISTAGHVVVDNFFPFFLLKSVNL